MKVPGIIYSLIAALGVWAVDYFTSGAGAGFPWAAIVVAAVPILIKSVTVLATKEEAIALGTARGSNATVPTESKTQKWLLG